MSDLQPGDELIAVDSGWGGPTIRRTGTVKRITPTGIVVMDNGDRLKPSDYRDNAYEVRGGSAWPRPTYYTPDHEVVEAAHANTRRQRAKNAVNQAHYEWRNALDATTARALAKAAREFAKEAD